MDRLCWADVRDLIVRVILPVLVLWALIVGIGIAVVGPLAGPLTAEEAINRGLAAHRSGAGDAITFVWSFLGSTQAIAGVCLVVSAFVLWHTRDWRLVVVASPSYLTGRANNIEELGPYGSDSFIQLQYKSETQTAPYWTPKNLRTFEIQAALTNALDNVWLGKRPPDQAFATELKKTLDEILAKPL